MIDGKIVVSVHPRTGEGLPWPVATDPLVDLRGAAKAVQQLARVAGVSATALADAMSVSGLPTTPARIKSMESMQDGRRTEVCFAELVAMCYAAISVLKQDSERGNKPAARRANDTRTESISQHLK